jgi:hypothetical protein
MMHTGCRAKPNWEAEVKTAEILKKMIDGADVVVSGGPIYSGREDGRWPVVHDPRNPDDPQPWVAYGTEYRYSGSELQVLSTTSKPEA